MQKMAAYLCLAFTALSVSACGTNPFERAITGAAAGAGAGAAVGAFVLPWGPAIGAIVGAGLGGTVGAVTSAKQIELFHPPPPSS
jgi:osmotically inducible lipoprotein OsmB